MSRDPIVEPSVLVDDPAPGVRLLTFNRPDARNAFNGDMYAALTDALRSASHDDATRVIVLTGAGTAFTAGQDLTELTALAQAQEHGRAASNGFPQLLDEISGCDKPLIGAVNGAAVGLGATMLPHLDVVLVGKSARLRLPFAEFGVPPEAASSYLLPATIGWQRAALMLYTGSWVDASEAVEWGLALRCVPDHELVGAAVELAARIATANLTALRAIKTLVMQWRRPHVESALSSEGEAYAAMLGAGTADAIHAHMAKADR